MPKALTAMAAACVTVCGGMLAIYVAQKANGNKDDLCPKEVKSKDFDKFNLE